MGIKSNETLVIGDDITTDILGAAGCNMRSILVGTGKFVQSDLMRKDIKIDYFCESLHDVIPILKDNSPYHIAS